MVYRRILLIPTLALLFPLIAFSSAPSSSSTLGSTLGWNDCIKLAVQNNADLKAAYSSLEAAESQYNGAKSGFLPQLSASLGYSQGNTTAINSTLGFGSGGGSSNFLASVSASQNLFAGFQDLARLKQAQANLEGAYASLDLTKAQVSFDLRRAFEGLRYAQEYKALTQEIIRRREENLNLVDLRFKGGRENKGSVLLSKAYLNQAKYEDFQAQNTERVALAQLARAIGIDESSERFSRTQLAHIRLEDNGTTHDFDLTKELPNFEQITKLTPEYRQSAAQQTVAEAAVTIARSPFFPTLNVTAITGKQGATFFPNDTFRWSAGVNLAFPFFSGGKDYYAIQSSVAASAVAENRRINASREILARLEQAYATYRESILKFDVDQSFKEATTLRAEIARKRYHNGLLAFENWDLIESDLISRQKVYLQSRRDRVIAEAAWEQIQGHGVFP